MYAYDQTFYEYIGEGAGRSAEAVVAVVARHFPARRVADFGCGQGVWLGAWRAQGATRVVGVDGDYVRRDRLAIPAEDFRAHDLTRPIDLNERFDLVQCLEVAEHLSPSAAGTLVDSLVTHADVVLFSAAPPGQGGEHHVNERPFEYWRGLFAARGYVPLDLVRPAVLDSKTVEPWYRYNTFVYVARPVLQARAESLGRWAVPDGVQLRDVSPVLYRLRRAAVRCLPRPLVTWLAGVKKRLTVAGRAM